VAAGDREPGHDLLEFVEPLIYSSSLDFRAVEAVSETRERISGRERYVEFNREYPGDWHVRIERVVAEPGQAVTWAHFTVGLEEMHAITFFTADARGRIATVTDFWPEPYEPPAGREHLAERY